MKKRLIIFDIILLVAVPLAATVFWHIATKPRLVVSSEAMLWPEGDEFLKGKRPQWWSYDQEKMRTSWLEMKYPRRLKERERRAKLREQAKKCPERKARTVFELARDRECNRAKNSIGNFRKLEGVENIWTYEEAMRSFKQDEITCYESDDINQSNQKICESYIGPYGSTFPDLIKYGTNYKQISAKMYRFKFPNDAGELVPQREWTLVCGSIDYLHEMYCTTNPFKKEGDIDPCKINSPVMPEFYQLLGLCGVTAIWE